MWCSVGVTECVGLTRIMLSDDVLLRFSSFNSLPLDGEEHVAGVPTRTWPSGESDLSSLL